MLRAPSPRPAWPPERPFTNMAQAMPPPHGPASRPLAGASGSAVPATPRWLLAIPDAIRQLDRDLLTRRDLGLRAAAELTDQRTQRVSQTRRSSSPWLISVEPGGQGPLSMNTTPLRF